VHGHRLTWAPPDVPVEEPCPVCGQRAGTHLVTAADGEPGRPDWAFARCGACATVYLRAQGRHVAHDEGLDDELFLTWYLESGAGLEAMLPPLLAHPWRPGQRFLDVGCGYGFSAWYVQKALGGQVLGLERASYGALGAHALGVEVLPAYVEPGTPLPGGPFDVVHASEVVEHVDDPQGFLHALRGALAPSGRLVLTTPDADSVSADRPDAEVVEALSPGLHRFLLARSRLRAMLSKAGFAHQHLVRNGGHLVVWASPSPLAEPDWRAVDADLLLDALAGLRGTGVPALERGVAYRQLRTLVQEGRLEAAGTALEALRALLVSETGLDPLRLGPDEVRAYTATASPAERVGRWPTFLGPLLYWLGMHRTLADPGDVGTRTQLFAQAVTVMRHDVATGHRYAHEAAWLVERARFHLLQVAAQTVAREAPVLRGTVPDDLPVSQGGHAERVEQELALLRGALAVRPGPAPAAP
jgi:SAM-dependent methyltransferase